MPKKNSDASGACSNTHNEHNLCVSQMGINKIKHKTLKIQNRLFRIISTKMTVSFRQRTNKQSFSYSEISLLSSKAHSDRAQ